MIQNENKLGLSCAKLRPANTSYPLVFGKLAYADADAAYYAQLCLLKLVAGGVINTLPLRHKISWAELRSTQEELVVSWQIVRG